MSDPWSLNNMMNARSQLGRVRYIAGVVAVPVALYALAATLLLLDLNRQPNFTYNWENNTLQGLYRFIERPSFAPFKLLEGLMTDSGQSPWVVLPAWIGFGLTGGPSLLWLRAPIALIAALAVPLLYFVGRWTNDERRRSNIDPTSFVVRPPSFVPTVAALLLALSPVYLLYARTATVVGISLVPALLTVLALLGVLRRPDLWWRTAALFATLALGAYAYAPIRFLWPMCVVLLLLEAFLRRKERARKRLLASAAFLLVAMPAFITAFDFDHGHDLVTSVGNYYSGRGEQIANLLVNAEDYNRLLGPYGQDVLPSPQQLAWDLVSRNASDMLDLFLDRRTAPALSDYWSPHGRLIPWWLTILLAVGLLRAAWLSLRRGGFCWRVVVLLFLGFTLPMLLTSQIHIGRLIFAVPFICLLVAFGLSTIVEFGRPAGTRISDLLLHRRRAKDSQTNAPPTTDYRLPITALAHRVSRIAFPILLVVAVAWSTWRDYTIIVPPTYESVVTRLLRAEVDDVVERGGGVALVVGTDEGLTIEKINSNQYRLMLRDTYHFYNLATGDLDVRRPGDTRPTLYIGGLMDRLKEPEKVPHYCENIYYVSPGLLEEFRELTQSHKASCAEPLVYKKLP